MGTAHPTAYQHFQRSQFAYVSAIGVCSVLFYLQLIYSDRTVGSEVFSLPNFYIS
ncbi:MAG: hypothetical protein F6K30_22410 [Cyanothece sp. SIO2G6]|nr:hypothetical protein [Cyanothece sp. SIO2G6]